MAQHSDKFNERGSKISKRKIFSLRHCQVEEMTHGAKAYNNVIGYFSSFASTKRWLHNTRNKRYLEDIFREQKPNELNYLEVLSFLIDQRFTVQKLWVLNNDLTLRGTENYIGWFKPWGGRPRETWLYKPGMIVGYIMNDIYHIGIIRGGPPDPELVEKFGTIERHEDVYHIQTVPFSRPYNPITFDHDHIDEARIFPVKNKIPDDLREALNERVRLSGGFDAEQ